MGSLPFLPHEPVCLFLRQRRRCDRRMASQGSEPMTDSQADRLLGIDNGDSQADGVMPPPISKEPTPDWLDKKNHPAAFPQAGSPQAV